MDIAAISSAYNGVKAAKDIFSALLQLKIDNESMLRIHEALQKLGQVQDDLFALRDQAAELQAKNEQLREELAALDRWNAVASKYGLAQTEGGAVVYRYSGEPQHFACPSCFYKRELHILQDSRNLSGTFACPACKFNYPVSPHRTLPPMQADMGSII